MRYILNHLVEIGFVIAFVVAWFWYLKAKDAETELGANDPNEPPGWAQKAVREADEMVVEMRRDSAQKK